MNAIVIHGSAEFIVFNLQPYLTDDDNKFWRSDSFYILTGGASLFKEHHLYKGENYWPKSITIDWIQAGLPSI